MYKNQQQLLNQNQNDKSKGKKDGSDEEDENY